MAAIAIILLRLATHPLLQSLTLEQVTTFVQLGSLLKRDIQQPQPVSQTGATAPDVLPPSVSQFLANAVGIPLECMDYCWDVLKDEVWESLEMPATTHDEDLFRLYGWKVGLSELPRDSISNKILSRKCSIIDALPPKFNLHKS